MNTVCNLFNATTDNVVINRDYSNDDIWLMINYNMTPCTSLEDVRWGWSVAYCQSTTCREYLPMLQWKIDVNGDTFRSPHPGLSIGNYIENHNQGFSYNTACNLFNATTDNVVVDRGDSGSVIWLMINYNLTTCGSLENIEMLWSAPYCQPIGCGASAPMIQWKINVEGGKYSTAWSTNASIYCGGVCPTNPLCVEGFQLYPDSRYQDFMCIREISQ
ncbi:unnamed protein product [Caenorhabditis auriculariae]|uniref:Uncharacterized protein n=1 Tax=Caenorhabditis auriculariae TaxID=2777116 RepID=A0A8S1HLB9_9PELO|nr:unnamed protein product [Caenorhabditis auriculariae]